MIEPEELAAFLDEKCRALQGRLDDAIRLPAEHVDHWLEVAADRHGRRGTLRAQRIYRDDLYRIRRAPERVTVVFAGSVRIELVRTPRSLWVGYLMPLVRDPPPPRLARWRDWIYAYPMDENDIVETLKSYASFCHEWDAREHDRRNPPPFAEQVGVNVHTAPGRFNVQTGWVLSVLDVRRWWYPFKPGIFNFRREPLTRDLVRGGWWFVAKDPVEAETGGVN